MIFLIQSLQAYDGQYESRAAKFAEAGFVRCRSDRGPDGKYWEVWLGYPFMLTGQLKNAKREVILSWVMQQGPGEITIAKEVEHWGASPD